MEYVIFLLVITFCAFTTGLTIVSREEWGAKSVNQVNLKTFPPTHVIIHHSASTSSCSTQSDCSRMIRSIQNDHIKNRKFRDIGYNFLIGGDGKVYEGRGWGKQGSHAPTYNSKSVGICFIGSFTSQLPTDKAIAAAKQLIASGVSKGSIANNYILIGHRQTKRTECPGNKLYEDVKTWPHWKSSP